MGQSRQTAEPRNNKRDSDTPWVWQVLVITAFISLSLAAEGLACHTNTLQPTSLTYYAVLGATNPPNQTITVSSTRTKKQGTLTASDNSSWLTVSPTTTSMTTSATIMGAVNTRGREPGTYNGTITIKVGTWCTYRAPVTLILSPATSPPPSTTSSATLTWSAVTGATVTGYKIYVGGIPRLYEQTIDVGNVTSSTVTSLVPGRTYYFAVTAYNNAGEGPPSNEVTKTIP